MFRNELGNAVEEEEREEETAILDIAAQICSLFRLRSRLVTLSKKGDFQKY